MFHQITSLLFPPGLEEKSNKEISDFFNKVISTFRSNIKYTLTTVQTQLTIPKKINANKTEGNLKRLKEEAFLTLSYQLFSILEKIKSFEKQQGENISEKQKNSITNNKKIAIAELLTIAINAMFEVENKCLPKGRGLTLNKNLNEIKNKFLIMCVKGLKKKLSQLLVDIHEKSYQSLIKIHIELTTLLHHCEIAKDYLLILDGISQKTKEIYDEIRLDFQQKNLFFQLMNNYHLELDKRISAFKEAIQEDQKKEYVQIFFEMLENLNVIYKTTLDNNDDLLKTLEQGLASLLLTYLSRKSQEIAVETSFLLIDLYANILNESIEKFQEIIALQKNIQEVKNLSAATKKDLENIPFPSLLSSQEKETIADIELFSLQEANGILREGCLKKLASVLKLLQKKTEERAQVLFTLDLNNHACDDEKITAQRIYLHVLDHKLHMAIRKNISVVDRKLISTNDISEYDLNALCTYLTSSSIYREKILLKKNINALYMFLKAEGYEVEGQGNEEYIFRIFYPYEYFSYYFPIYQRLLRWQYAQIAEFDLYLQKAQQWLEKNVLDNPYISIDIRIKKWFEYAYEKKISSEHWGEPYNVQLFSADQNTVLEKGILYLILNNKEIEYRLLTIEGEIISRKYLFKDLLKVYENNMEYNHNTLRNCLKELSNKINLKSNIDVLTPYLLNLAQINGDIISSGYIKERLVLLKKTHPDKLSHEISNETSEMFMERFAYLRNRFLDVDAPFSGQHCFNFLKIINNSRNVCNNNIINESIEEYSNMEEPVDPLISSQENQLNNALSLLFSTVKHTKITDNSVSNTQENFEYFISLLLQINVNYAKDIIKKTPQIIEVFKRNLSELTCIERDRKTYLSLREEMQAIDKKREKIEEEIKKAKEEKEKLEKENENFVLSQKFS